MRSNVQSGLLALFLLAVIGGMSWRDMHPPVPRNTGGAPAAFTYYAGPEITARMVPGDSNPVIIEQGALKYTAAGNVVWAHDGMPPATFAQRQISLLMRMDALPRNPDETLEKINSLIEEWKKQGNTVISVFLDYRPRNSDLKAYAGFLKASRSRLRDYMVGAVIDAAWLDSPGLQRLAEHTPLFMIDAPSLRPSPGLEKSGYGMALRFPAGIFPDDIDTAAFRDLKSSPGYVFTLDPRKPWPVKQEKIGIFPKF